MSLVTRGLGGRGFIVTRGLGDNGVRPAVLVTISYIIGEYSLFSTLYGEHNPYVVLEAIYSTIYRLGSRYSLIRNLFGEKDFIDTFLGIFDVERGVEGSETELTMLGDNISVNIDGFISNVEDVEDVISSVQESETVQIIGDSIIEKGITGESDEL